MNGKVRLVLAWLGGDKLTRQGMGLRSAGCHSDKVAILVRQHHVEGPGLARRGMVGKGMDRRGSARHGLETTGSGQPLVRCSGRDSIALRGLARLGMARRGLAYSQIMTQAEKSFAVSDSVVLTHSGQL